MDTYSGMPTRLTVYTPPPPPPQPVDLASVDPKRRREIRKAMFPKLRRVWFARWRAFGWPVGKGCDEWARHTFWISVPYVITVIVAYKWCDCEDELDVMCHFPGCPAMGTGGIVGEPTYCMTHDADFYRSWLAGEYEDVIA